VQRFAHRVLRERRFVFWKSVRSENPGQQRQIAIAERTPPRSRKIPATFPDLTMLKTVFFSLAPHFRLEKLRRYRRGAQNFAGKIVRCIPKPAGLRRRGQRQRILHFATGEPAGLPRPLGSPQVPLAVTPRYMVHFRTRIFFVTTKSSSACRPTIPTGCATVSISGERFSIPAATNLSIAKRTPQTLQ